MSEKEKILKQELDEKELEAVNGGIMGAAKGQGRCTENYYAKPCTATVEAGSECWWTDYCALTNERYTLVV